MKVLVGSTAAKQWFPDFRKPKDVDYFADVPVEGETFFHPALYNYWANKDVAKPNELYTLKVSHSFWVLRNGSWSKHMRDIVFFQDKGCRLYPDLFQLMYKIWEEVHGVKRANLNVSAHEFFNRSVDRTYDHDSVHRSVAYGSQPLYETILRDGHEVAVDKVRFDALPFEDKLRLVREEVYATALERVIIPSEYSEAPSRAYRWALMKTITSFSKGWFPLFIVENYSQLQHPDIDYVQHHRDKAHLLIPLDKR